MPQTNLVLYFSRLYTHFGLVCIRWGDLKSDSVLIPFFTISNLPHCYPYYPPHPRERWQSWCSDFGQFFNPPPLRASFYFCKFLGLTCFFSHPPPQAKHVLCERPPINYTRIKTVTIEFPVKSLNHTLITLWFRWTQAFFGVSLVT